MAQLKKAADSEQSLKPCDWDPAKSSLHTWRQLGLNAKQSYGRKRICSVVELWERLPGSELEPINISLTVALFLPFILTKKKYIYISYWDLVRLGTGWRLICLLFVRGGWLVMSIPEVYARQRCVVCMVDGFRGLSGSWWKEPVMVVNNWHPLVGII